MKVKTEVTFAAELKNEPIICNLCKSFDIILNIVEASFSTDIGWAILVLEGDKAELEKVFEFIREKGIKIENIQEVH